MPTIGLTGDVGAGKSTLCGVWRSLGAYVIDADAAAKSMWSDPAVQAAAAERWGHCFFEEPMPQVYKKIADKIFGSKTEYDFAAKLLYNSTITALRTAAQHAGGIVVVEMPLLYECGADSWMDAVVFAAADIKKRAERNSKRSWDENEIRRREACLSPREEKILRADIVLVNDGTEEEWRRKAEETWKTLEKIKSRRLI